MLNVLYPILILIGLTIAGVMLFLWRQARVAAQLNVALIQLNEVLRFDAPALLEQSWSLLQRGGIAGMHWRLNWFGVLIDEKVGAARGLSVAREIEIGDMHLSICVWLSRKGERHYFAQSLVETYFLLLRTDMWIKSGTIDATQAQLAKLNLFLQHDMKNIAQFIQLMSDQLLDVSPEKEAELVRYLRTASPYVRQRADNIVQTLTLGKFPRSESLSVDLKHLFLKMGEIYQLQLKVDGNATIYVPLLTMERALDNVFKNYQDIKQRLPVVCDAVSIKIEKLDRRVIVEMTDHRAQEKKNLERLFEPFWTCDPSGLGVGLFQAKTLLRECGAELSAYRNESSELYFCLIFNLE